jgi:hypothetical protein
MARSIKRLSERSRLLPVAQLRRREPEAWAEALEWWRGVGIDVELLLVLLEGARLKRRLYEEELEARADSGQTSWNIRRWRRALKEAEPLIRLLKPREMEVSPGRVIRVPIWSVDGPPDTFFGDLGEEVERAVWSYIAFLCRPSASAHRPGEPWLRITVLVLMRWLTSGPPKPRSASQPGRARWVKQSRRRALREIEALLKLAGHGDVVTANKIRHYVREDRKRGQSHSARPLLRRGMPDELDAAPRSRKSGRAR